MDAKNISSTSLPVSLKLMVLSLKALQNFAEKSYFQHLIWEFINFFQKASKITTKMYSQLVYTMTCLQTRKF